MPATRKPDLNAQQLPVVSVIVPARNEEASLQACLDSLIVQTGVAFEVIVVDDRSTDGTRAIADSFSAQTVRVLEAAPLPLGWTGKNNAVVTGARVALGRWLLFTDADTIHLPGSLARSLAEAQQQKAALLSYSPQQIVNGFWQKAVMPVIFAELAAAFRPSEVSNSRSRAAAANGQYILITREAYESIGGHAAIAASLLEDVELARRVKQSGRKIFFRYAADAVRTRMYRTFKQLREGWTKNLALLFAAPVRLAALRMIEFVLIVGSSAIAIIASLRGHSRPAILSTALFLILFSLFLGRIRHAHFSWSANFLAIFGLPLFSYLLLRSKRFHDSGNVTWKGRTYSGKTHSLATATDL
jgi:glycosyltransferase involved in cell wall biosynthesis